MNLTGSIDCDQECWSKHQHHQTTWCELISFTQIVGICISEANSRSESETSDLICRTERSLGWRVDTKAKMFTQDSLRSWIGSRSGHFMKSSSGSWEDTGWPSISSFFRFSAPCPLTFRSRSFTVSRHFHVQTAVLIFLSMGHVRRYLDPKKRKP